MDNILLGNTWWRCESGCGHVHSGVAKSGERPRGTVSAFGAFGGQLTKSLANILEMVAERGGPRELESRRYILEWESKLHT